MVRGPEVWGRWQAYDKEVEMYERVDVRINGEWVGGDLVQETESGYIVILDTTGKRTACSKRQVRRWMRSE